MKVLYLKDNYDILLIITVPDVAYLKRIKRAKQLYILELRPLPPSPLINWIEKLLEYLGHIVILFKA
jgi:translation elongation factor EF-4